MAGLGTGQAAAGPFVGWLVDGTHSHSNSCPVRHCALAAPRVRWSAARIAATQAAQRASRRKESHTQAQSSQQHSQAATTATYPEPETEKERSPLDYPQVGAHSSRMHTILGISFWKPGQFQVHTPPPPLPPPTPQGPQGFDQPMPHAIQVRTSCTCK